MKPKTLNTRNNNLSKVQLKTFEKFRRKLKENVPDYRLTWVHPYSETIIEAGFEPQKGLSYRKTMRAAKLATELHDKTGILIILR